MLAVSPRPDLISAEQLKDLDPLSEDLVVLDVHLRSPGHNCEAIYLAGHIPGARFFDLTAVLRGGPDGLPDVDLLQDRLRLLGIDRGTRVVVYVGHRYPVATQAWWVLRWAGLERVAVLDGGLGCWLDCGGSLELGGVSGTIGSAVLWPGAMPIVSAHELPAIARDGVLLDSRDAATFRTREQRGMALPGAVNSPTELALDDDGRLLPVEELRHYYARLGVDESVRVAVDGAGAVAATLTVFALESIGVRAALHPRPLEGIDLAQVGI